VFHVSPAVILDEANPRGYTTGKIRDRVAECDTVASACTGIKKSALRSKAKLADISRDGKQSSVWRQIDH